MSNPNAPRFYKHGGAAIVEMHHSVWGRWCVRTVEFPSMARIIDKKEFGWNGAAAKEEFERMWAIESAIAALGVYPHCEKYYYPVGDQIRCEKCLRTWDAGEESPCSRV